MKNMMATITLEYDYSDVQAQKTPEHILSAGLFKPATIVTGEDEVSIAEKRQKLDSELKNYTANLSNFKFCREEANIYDE